MNKPNHLQENKDKWKKLLKEGKAFCYIKPNRYVHDSGYRCFEVGYLTLKDDGKRSDEKLVLSTGSDHFWHHRGFLENTPPLEFSMDILLDGYIRLFPVEDKIFTWENSYNWVVSSFSLEEMKDE